jgi:hypothetical protein
MPRNARRCCGTCSTLDLGRCSTSPAAGTRPMGCTHRSWSDAARVPLRERAPRSSTRNFIYCCRRRAPRPPARRGWGLTISAPRRRLRRDGHVNMNPLRPAIAAYAALQREPGRRCRGPGTRPRTRREASTATSSGGSCGGDVAGRGRDLQPVTNATSAAGTPCGRRSRHVSDGGGPPRRVSFAARPVRARREWARSSPATSSRGAAPSRVRRCQTRSSTPTW